jgi:hypothetical protein
LDLTLVSFITFPQPRALPIEMEILFVRTKENYIEKPNIGYDCN